MPRYGRPYEDIDKLFETELDHLKMMIESGVVLAIPAAKYHCLKFGKSVPDWLEHIPLTFRRILHARNSFRISAQCKKARSAQFCDRGPQWFAPRLFADLPSVC